MIYLALKMKNENKIKAIITDFGGVLVHTRDDSVYRQLAERRGLTPAEMWEIIFHSPSAQAATLGIIPEQEHWLSIAHSLNLKAEELPAFRSEFWSSQSVDENLLAYLKVLKPFYRLGILSNAWSDSEREIRETLPGLLDLFDDVIISSQVGIAKPDERIYHLAVERLNIQPQEAVLLDDIEDNIIGARNAGLNAILVRNSNQAIADLQQLLKKQGN